MSDKKRYERAVFIGRFQPIHDAHLKLIEDGLKMAEKLIIVIGSSNKPATIKNPWTIKQRKEFIQGAILEAFGEPQNKSWSDVTKPSILDRVEFTTCRDYLYNDYRWSSEVYSKALAAGATNDKKTALLGCLKDDSSYYLEMFPQWKQQTSPYLWNLDSTDIRNELFEQGGTNPAMKIPDSTRSAIDRWMSLEEDDFLYLVEEYEHYKDYHKQWEDAPYPPTFNTIDSVVIKSGCILLIKRGFHPGKGLWGLPGGFLDKSERITDGALRELKEETRIKVDKVELEKNIETMEVFDHPLRSLRGRTITYAHLIDLGHGPLPDVKHDSDASGAFWLPIADVHKGEEKFFEDHYDILTKLTSKY